MDTGRTPAGRKNKNAASKFQSRRKKVSHPLPDLQAGDSTPPAAREQREEDEDCDIPIMPEHPTLMTAPEMVAAATSSASVPNNDNENNDEKSDGMASAATSSSHTSSTEAMAAHVEVEASLVSKKRNSSRSGSRKLSLGNGTKPTAAKSASQAGRKYPTVTPNKVWLIAIPILLSFLVCEFFLWLLVFRFRDGMAAGRVVVAPGIPEVNINHLADISHEEMADDEGGEVKIEDGDIITGDDFDSFGVSQGVSGVSSQNRDYGAEEPSKETSMDGEEPPKENAMDAEEPTKETGVDATEPPKETDMDPEELPNKTGIDAEEPPKETGMDAEELPKETGVDANDPPKETDVDATEPQEETDTDLEELPKETGMDTEELPKETGMDAEEPPKETGVDAEESQEETGVDATEPPKETDMDPEELPNKTGMDTEEPPKETGMDAEELPKENGMDANEPPKGTGMGAEESQEETVVDAKELPEETDMDLEELPNETGVESSGEITKLQYMLEEGFSILSGSVVESDEESSRKLVESLCGNVWVIANEKLSLQLPKRAGIGSEQDIEHVARDVTLEQMSQIATNPWKSLALDAQRCLGGAGLVFLTEDVDNARLQVSTKVFDRLSYVEPYDPNIRAGLGTSLLFESIFHHEISDSNAKESNEVQRLLRVAKYHLKIASVLCSTSSGETVGAGSEDTDISETSIAAIDKKLTKNDEERLATNAAILHNLAIVFIALGDNENSVPILLRSAALRREHSIDTKPYWNAPHDVLQVAEEKALLIAAKARKPEVEKRTRIPFLPVDFHVGEMVGI